MTRTKDRLSHLAARAVGSLTKPLGYIARFDPPNITTTRSRAERSGDISWYGRSYTQRHGGVILCRLEGSPEQIGAAHVALLYEKMIDVEGVVWGLLDDFVPSPLWQRVLLDVAPLRYRKLDGELTDARRREIAAMARDLDPDPFRHRIETYRRLVYLNALYDISLSFESSPLIGCTSFVTPYQGGAVLTRAFDFEAHDIFDEMKVVFLVREKDATPFASVAWPGFVGVVSGMNADGLAVVVHGARAGKSSTRGEPVAHTLRRLLSTASTVDEAHQLLERTDCLVSHLIVATDRSGSAAAFERVPGELVHRRSLEVPSAVTNHLEGPKSADPKNQRIVETTSSMARRLRADELLREAGDLDDAACIELLRDRKGTGGTELELGDRRAIDALIATHGVVMNSKTLTLHVSEAPHLLGRFLAFDLGALLDARHAPEPGAVPSVTAEADDLSDAGARTM